MLTYAAFAAFRQPTLATHFTLSWPTSSSSEVPSCNPIASCDELLRTSWEASAVAAAPTPESKQASKQVRSGSSTGTGDQLPQRVAAHTRGVYVNTMVTCSPLQSACSTAVPCTLWCNTTPASRTIILGIEVRAPSCMLQHPMFTCTRARASH